MTPVTTPALLYPSPMEWTQLALALVFALVSLVCVVLVAVGLPGLWAMIETDRWLAQSGCDARMIMQVHDELVLEVAENALDQVREAIVSRMTGAADLAVDLVVDVGIGENWDEAH